MWILCMNFSVNDTRSVRFSNRFCSVRDIFLDINITFKHLSISYHIVARNHQASHSTVLLCWFQLLKFYLKSTEYHIEHHKTVSKVGKIIVCQQQIKNHQIWLGSLFSKLYHINQVGRLYYVCLLRRMTSKNDIVLYTIQESRAHTFEWDDESDFIIYYHKLFFFLLCVYIFLSLSLFSSDHHYNIVEKSTEQLELAKKLYF